MSFCVFYSIEIASNYGLILTNAPVADTLPIPPMAIVAQLVEHRVVILEVAGSSPVGRPSH